MRICKHDVISCFPHLSDSTPFSYLTSVFKYRMQTVRQINLLPFSLGFIRWYTEMDRNQKMFEFSSDMAATKNL